MKRYTIATAALILTACATPAYGGAPHQPVSPDGRVTDAKYSPPWVQYMPGRTYCSGKPPSCYTVPGMPITHQEEWRLEITDINNHDWVGTVEVDQRVYQICNLDELWPKCSRGDAGDVRAEGRQ